MLKIKYTKLRCYLKYLINYRTMLPFRMRNSTEHFQIILEGGLGDIILGTQFINQIKLVNPNCRLSVYYRDDNTEANPENFSWGSTRKYSAAAGTKHNPIKEWIDSFYIVDESIGCNIDDLKGMTRFYPPQLGSIRGYCSPSTYNNHYLIKKFDDLKPTVQAEKIIQEIENYKSKKVKIIALHLRRNASLAISFALKLQELGFKCHFILLGSSEHQKIPDFSKLNSTTVLIDSYSLGLDTVQLLSITRLSDLYVGGRGGFELFHWLSEIPSVNFFDEHGYIEVAVYLWPKSLWENNIINELFSDSTEFNYIVEKHISKLEW